MCKSPLSLSTPVSFSVSLHFSTIQDKSQNLRFAEGWLWISVRTLYISRTACRLCLTTLTPYNYPFIHMALFSPLFFFVLSSLHLPPFLLLLSFFLVKAWTCFSSMMLTSHILCSLLMIKSEGSRNFSSLKNKKHNTKKHSNYLVKQFFIKDFFSLHFFFLVKTRWTLPSLMYVVCAISSNKTHCVFCGLCNRGQKGSASQCKDIRKRIWRKSHLPSSLMNF